MPSVEPSVSALITAALIGSTTDPNARNINSIVVVSRTTSISGSFVEQAVDAVLLKRRVRRRPERSAPSAAEIDRNSVSFLAASFAFARPFWITRTESSLGCVVPFGPETHGLPSIVGQARSCQVVVGEPGDRGGVVADLGDLLIGDLAVVVALDHQRQLVRAIAGEQLVEFLLRHPDRVVRRQVLLADAAEATGCAAG